MLRSLAKRLQFGVERFLPDAFIFAIFLTFIVFVAGMIVVRQTPMEMLQHWYGGFWAFLTFAMQMILILVFGFCLALAPPMQKLLRSIASFPKTPVGALTIVMITAFVLGWVNWGIGMIAGPLLAREIAKRMDIDFPILIAGAYSAWMAGIAGLSAAAALWSASPGHQWEEVIGIVPVSETIFSVMWNVALVVGIICLILVFRKMMPLKEDFKIYKPEEDTPEPAEKEEKSGGNKTAAERLESAGWINLVLCIMGFVVIIHWFVTQGFNLTLDIIIFILLFAGLALHKTPISYVRAMQRSISGSAGIALQFPFYAGIQGMMFSSGLAMVIVDGLVSISTAATLPFLTYVASAVINIFVPSAGGQWLVQGGIISESMLAMGLSPASGINAYTFGDLVTNLLQPFWALPVLGIAGLKIRDIWGYCIIGFFVLFIIWGGSVAFLMGV